MQTTYGGTPCAGASRSVARAASQACIDARKRATCMRIRCGNQSLDRELKKAAKGGTVQFGDRGFVTGG